MRRQLPIRPLAGLLLVLFCAVTALAWVQTGSAPGGPFFRRVSGSYDFSYEATLSPSAGQVASAAALDAARATINGVVESDATQNRIGDFDFTEPIDDDVAGGIAIGDGNNRVFFFTTDSNNDTSPFTLAFAVIGGNLVGGEVQVSDCDLAFNEEDFTWSTNFAGGTQDIESVGLHELGHCMAVGHSHVAGTFDSSGHQTSVFAQPVQDFSIQATMYPFDPENIDARGLEPDDIAALSTIYPNAMTTANFGSISGTVRNIGGTGIIGAHVVAVTQAAPNTPVTGYLADVDQTSVGTDGFFRLTGLPPGNYLVRIEPLIGWPNIADNSNVFGGGAAFDETFPPEFWSGGTESAADAAPDSTDAAVVVVTAGNTTTGINIVTNTLGALNNNTFPGTTIGANTFTDFLNITGANTEGGEPTGTCFRNAASRTAWYTFTALSDGTITFSARGSSYDTAAAAYTGATVNALAEVGAACSEDLGNVAFGDHPQSQISFPATNGTIYRFQVSDSNLDSSIGVELGNTLVVNFTFQLAGNDAPVAVNDSYTTGPNQQLVIDDGCPGASTFNDLLCNDTDTENDPIMVDVASVTQPANGSVVVMADGSFTYTPNLGFSGMDTFTYRATDGALSNVATVTITVDQCTRVFDNDGADNQFENTQNWDPDGPPDFPANAVPCIGGDFAVTHSSGVETIFSLRHTSTMPLTFTGGTLTMDGNSEIGAGGLVLTSGALDMDAAATLTINGPVDWQAGTMAGSGGSFSLSGGATLSSAGNKTINGAQVLVPIGQIVTWTDGNIRINNGSIFTNAGILNANNNDTFEATSGSGTFVDAGTLNKVGGGGFTRTTNVVTFISSGIVNVDADEFNLGGPGTITGPVNVAIMGATFSMGGFGGATVNFNSGGSVTGAGLFAVGQGTANFNNGAFLSTAVRMDAATLNLTTGSTTSIPSLLWIGAGTVNANDALNLGGLTWPCGTFGGAQTVTLNGAGTLNDTACGDKILNGPELINNNTITWTGGNIQLGTFPSSTALRNQGTFAIQTDADIIDGGGGGNSFVNEAVGTILKSAGAGTSTIPVSFLNMGLVESQSGTLELTGSAQQASGTTRLNGGDLAGISMVFNGGLLEGAGNITGTVPVQAAGTLAPGFSPGVINQTGDFFLAFGGTLNIELEGTTPGTGAGMGFHDRYNVTGTATFISATLNVSLFGGFMPMVGDSFTIMTFGSRSGQPTIGTLPNVSPNEWQVSFNATDITLTLLANAPPNAVDDAYMTNEEVQLVVNAANGVLANDTDSSAMTVNTTPIMDVSNGTLMLNADGSFTYTPDPNFAGMDSFVYEVCDIEPLCSTATATITVNPVNDAPTYTQAVVGAGGPEDGFSQVSNVTTNMSPGGGADEAGQTLNFIVLNDNPGLFAVPPAINATTGELTFTLAQDANGSANLTITLMDNGGTANGGVDTSSPPTMFLLEVFPVNDSPVANDDMFTVGENSMNNILDVLANDTDVDMDTLTVTQITVAATNGTATANGTNVLYTPNMGFTGMDTFTYEACDPSAACDTAVVTINVVANFPPVAGDDLATTNEDTPVIINVLANDNDGGDGGPLSVTMVTAPASGMAVINMDNTVTYTPNADFNGMDSFMYTLSDTFTTDTATVNVTINAVNDAPTFTQSCTTVNDVEDVGAVSIPACMQNMSPGPADEAAQALNFLVMNDNAALFSVQPAISATTGDLTFTTAPNANGTANLTVRLMDNGGTANGGVDTSGSVMVQINIAAVNDPPVITAGPTSNPASPIPGNTAMGASVMFSITASDPDNDPLTFSWTGGCGASSVEDPTLTCPFGMGLMVNVTVSDPSMATDMGSITVDVTDYSITAACQGGTPPCNSATMATISRGQAANFNLTAMGINGTYVANITYACMNLPAQTTCTFTPSASVANAPPGGVVTMLRIQTTAPGFAQLQGPAGPQRSQPPFLAVFLSVPGLALFGLVLAGGRGQRRSLGSVCLLAIVLLMAGVLVGCGSGGDFFSGLGNQGTPTGSHAITINAQGTGTLSHSANLTVVVQ